MSEPTTGGPKVPSRSDSKPTENKVADEVKSTTDQAANKVTGIRARVRAIRSDNDVQEVMKDAKPFLAGAAIVGGMFVDPVLTATVAVNRIGRRIERARRHSGDTTPNA